jgi:hypothetical protein
VKWESVKWENGELGRGLNENRVNWENGKMEKG